MCLILFAVRPNPVFRLVVAANRDEFYGRPASRADYWQDKPGILAGRDLQMGGTWLGLSTSGRFAAVTNFKEVPPEPVPPRSRGDLPADFLAASIGPEDYLLQIESRSTQYRGFNLIIDDGTYTYYYSNRQEGYLKLAPGYYGLSNQLLNCDWPKVSSGQKAMADLVSSQQEDRLLHESLFALLAETGDGTPYSNSFITTAEYGTCASSVLTITQSGSVFFQEQGFTQGGKPDQLSSFRLPAGNGSTDHNR